MKSPPRLALLAFVLVTSALVAGCFGSSRASLTLTGRAPLNLNDSGESTAVKVRIYPLKADRKFRSTTVESLWTDDLTVLKDDLAGARVEITVRPTSANEAPATAEVAYDGDAKYIAVLALCSKADARDQRALVLPVDEANGAKLVLSGYAVALATDKK